jgi:cytochrome d ubiquinol oxidase subunit II
MIEFDLNSLWFLLIAILWIGYFFLEGFDFGVGMLLPFVARDDVDRRIVIHTIGPVWDGNEVWLIVAGGATFAAFPEWYATLFSGFYLPLFLILAALIIRGVAFEFRGKDKRPQWRAWWDRAIFFGSVLPAVLWGVAFANIVRGVPIGADGEYAGGFFDLLNPYALYAGLTTVLLFLVHGGTYLSLKTSGDVSERSHTFATRLSLPAALVTFGFLTWTWRNAVTADNDGVVPGFIPIIAALLLFVVVWLLREHFEGWAFAGSGLAVALIVLTLFMNLYPRVMPSSIDSAFDLTIYNAASTNTTLTVMTVVALIFTPIVLLYQGWTYWVFRRRLTRESLSPTAS